MFTTSQKEMFIRYSQFSTMMENSELIYYLQLLFNDRRDRDNMYRQELYLDPLITISSAHGKMPEVLYKQKGTHKTGAKKWYGAQEELVTIEIIIQGVDAEYLDTLTGFKECKKKKVSQATLAFTARASDPNRLKNFKSELVKICENQGISNRTFSGITYNWLAYLEGYLNGPIRPVLHIYDFAKNRGIKYKSIDVEFS